MSGRDTSVGEAGRDAGGADSVGGRAMDNRPFLPRVADALVGADSGPTGTSAGAAASSLRSRVPGAALDASPAGRLY